jgi:hypothetical protein
MFPAETLPGMHGQVGNQRASLARCNAKVWRLRAIRQDCERAQNPQLDPNRFLHIPVHQAKSQMSSFGGNGRQRLIVVDLANGFARGNRRCLPWEGDKRHPAHSSRRNLVAPKMLAPMYSDQCRSDVSLGVHSGLAIQNKASWTTCMSKGRNSVPAPSDLFFAAR